MLTAEFLFRIRSSNRFIFTSRCCASKMSLIDFSFGIKDKYNRFGKHGWNLTRGTIPQIRQIAERQGQPVLASLYDYLYPIHVWLCISMFNHSYDLAGVPRRANSHFQRRTSPAISVLMHVLMEHFCFAFTSNSSDVFCVRVWVSVVELVRFEKNCCWHLDGQKW